MQLFVKRVHRDDAFIAKMEAEVVEFLAELSQTLEALRDRYQVAA